MEVPKNCYECQYARNCRAWHYGSDYCVYKAEILRRNMEVKSDD